MIFSKNWAFSIGLSALAFANVSAQDTSFNANYKPAQVLGNHLISYKDYYTVSFSDKHRNPEWVAYTLTPEQRTQSNITRTGSFKKDPQTPNAASNDDYNACGYDRGHLVPCEDMSFAPDAMEASFFTTNVSPQDPSFNRGIWKSLEDKVRGWAEKNKKIYVIAGGVLPAELPADTKYVGKNKNIFVPKKFYKVVLIYEGDKKQAIGFVFDNAKATVPLAKSACSVDAVEQLTGLNFFPTLSPEEDALLEGNFDLKAWGL